MSPLSTAFIGSYFLNPYFARYESALNLAAAQFVAEEERLHRPMDRPYTLVQTRNVGMTGIMLFARDAAALKNMKTAEVGFGAGDMSNKGAVGLRMTYNKDGEETELTFVSTHLAAMEWNLERRNRNWQNIVSGLVFDDPKKILSEDQAAHKRSGSSGETQPLLFHPSTVKELHDLSIYKPGSHLFVAGDLNYRISKTSPPQDAVFPVLDPKSDDYFPRFLPRDQLTAEKAAGRTLHGMSEAPINFPPTYKYKVLPRQPPETDLARIGAEEDEDEEVQWKFAGHRWPGWCDRVLYLDIPTWVKDFARETEEVPKMDVLAYDCLPVVRSSDHRAVFLRVRVPVLRHEELAPPSDMSPVVGEGGVTDPRFKLPAEIEIESWEHRASVKKWEVLIGWSMAISQSKQGIMFFTTVLAVGIWACWYGGAWSS
jgi:hypothetical protein